MHGLCIKFECVLALYSVVDLNPFALLCAIWSFDPGWPLWQCKIK